MVERVKFFIQCRMLALHAVDAQAANYFGRFIIGVATLLASDALWLGLAAPALGLYDGKYRVVQGRAPTAFLLYALLAAGVSSRVVASSVALAARAGALLGLLAFGTFNITHWALSERWDATIGLIDTAYGIVKWTSALSAQHFAADLF